MRFTKKVAELPADTVLLAGEAVRVPADVPAVSGLLMATENTVLEALTPESFANCPPVAMSNLTISDVQKSAAQKDVPSGSRVSATQQASPGAV